ncbi:unnamed protein product [Rotaria sp. Silwood2]|nr:unnamed protein product [Rotaria sp. Silwood2]
MSRRRNQIRHRLQRRQQQQQQQPQYHATFVVRSLFGDGVGVITITSASQLHVNVVPWPSAAAAAAAAARPPPPPPATVQQQQQPSDQPDFSQFDIDNI